MLLRPYTCAGTVPAGAAGSSDGNVRVKKPTRKEVVDGLEGLKDLLGSTLQEGKDTGLATTLPPSELVLTGATGTFDGGDGVGLATIDLGRVGEEVERVRVVCDK